MMFRSHSAAPCWQVMVPEGDRRALPHTTWPQLIMSFASEFHMSNQDVVM